MPNVNKNCPEVHTENMINCNHQCNNDRTAVIFVKRRKHIDLSNTDSQYTILFRRTIDLKIHSHHCTYIYIMDAKYRATLSHTKFDHFG